MTWEELAQIIMNKMSKEERGTDLTVYREDIDEYFPLADGIGACDDRVLDEGHPFLIIPDGIEEL